MLTPAIPSVGINLNDHTEIVRTAQGTSAVLAALAAPPTASSQEVYIPPSTIEIQLLPPTLSPIVTSPFANKTGDP